jgi:excisionase family DNA binding protein
MDKFKDAPQMLTPEEAAARLSVHVETLRRLIRRGELPARKIGRMWRIDARDLAALAAPQSNEAV